MTPVPNTDVSCDTSWLHGRVWHHSCNNVGLTPYRRMVWTRDLGVSA